MKRIDILCEDRAHFSFVNTFLKKMGYARGIYQIPFPTKCGKDHVIRNFPKNVKELRKKGLRSRALVAILDADNHTIDQDRKVLLATLGNEPITSSDKVLIVIPKWEIETWVLFLSGQTVDESIKCPEDRKIKDKIKDAAKKLAEHCQANSLPKDAPPSLKTLCKSDWRDRLPE